MNEYLNTTYDLRSTTYDLRPTTYDLRPTTYDLRPTTYNLRQDGGDLRHSLVTSLRSSHGETDRFVKAHGERWWHHHRHGYWPDSRLGAKQTGQTRTCQGPPVTPNPPARLASQQPSALCSTTLPRPR
ncbi:unnamed protein product [Lota lota]